MLLLLSLLSDYFHVMNDGWSFGMDGCNYGSESVQLIKENDLEFCYY